MSQHPRDTWTVDDSREMVLDNRKLVLLFFVLLAICGCFFVAGYVFRGGANIPDNDLGSDPVVNELNDPGVEAYNRSQGILVDTVPPTRTSSGLAPATTTPVPETPTTPAPTPPQIAASAVPPAPALVPEEATPSPQESVKRLAEEVAKKVLPPPPKPVAAGKTVYSVQLGAFRARREVELKAREIKNKGFEPRIEVPQNPDDWYRLKVGNFTTLAEARAMRDSLKKIGIDAIIKEGKEN